MPVENLQEATQVLRGAHDAIERLSAETVEMERAALRAAAETDRSDEAVEASWKETGWGPFADAAYRIIRLLEGIEERQREESDRRLAS